MKVLWIGDACVGSGFARCTHGVCDELAARGHEVSVIGINYSGDPHTKPYEVWPAGGRGRDPGGVMRLQELVELKQPDVAVLLNDPWNVQPYVETLRSAKLDVPMVGWLAVDGENQKAAHIDGLARAVFWTDFAADQFATSKVPRAVVPVGLDDKFRGPWPDRTTARALSVSRNTLNEAARNKFIVGVFGRNQPRKRIDLAMGYFASWVNLHRVEDAWLQLHLGPTGDVGFDIPALVDYYGLYGKVGLTIPPAICGVDDETLVAEYRSCDVVLTTTQGEGWGLTTHEAMACGVPVVAPRWSGLGSWAEDAAVLVECDSVAMTAPTNGLLYTVGGVPSPEGTVAALDRLYRDEVHRAAVVRAGRARALDKRYTWPSVASAMEQVLSEVVAEQESRERERFAQEGSSGEHAPQHGATAPGP